ncbi:FGGY-family carbohydrate kinase [Vibrio sp. S9_S30]|uniref:FGGY-family carbohydrate kinase n=1 Tax=Vibrio sp. S9_S30 TaxID=2720226 RepID=UPI0016804174|nr:FGGY-family carbohydrate kinase [Vibrio sp. S9_S30]MBD1556319.1 FGGY-family carbohydrate kinase [Vibrio sp. S9_S30]
MKASNVQFADKYVVGVDVGTGSARAGVYDLQGKELSTAKYDVLMFSNENARYEQSSDQIWDAVGGCVRAAVSKAGIDKHHVIGISFDATCSLVVIGDEDQPLPVGSHNNADRNVIVWMDQRATPQAKRINEEGHSVLHYVGNRISPEMETPKLLWLKENLPETYLNAKHFFDLTDYLTWKSSGSLLRSICTTVCKWTYLAHENRWDETYFNQFGLNELTHGNFAKIGSTAVAPGTPLAQGLTQDAAAHLGLPVGTAVAAGLIDAHAGGVGSVGAINEQGISDPTASLAYVFGTSACTMTTSSTQTLVAGVWGPYYSAMIPGMWLNEAGQSAAGAAMDHLIQSHPAFPELKAIAHIQCCTPVQYLSEQAKALCPSLSDAVFLAKGLHVLPEFLGNRAPHADPDARGAVLGLDMDDSIESLVKLYVAGLCGLAYGLKQIIDAQSAKGIHVRQVVVSGGAGQDPLIRQILADATALPIVAPVAAEPVMLGSAIMAAVAAGAFTDVFDAMKTMSHFGEQYVPATGEVADIHRQRYAAFIEIQKTVSNIREI